MLVPSPRSDSFLRTVLPLCLPPSEFVDDVEEMSENPVHDEVLDPLSTACCFPDFPKFINWVLLVYAPPNSRRVLLCSRSWSQGIQSFVFDVFAD